MSAPKNLVNRLKEDRDVMNLVNTWFSQGDGYWDETTKGKALVMVVARMVAKDRSAEGGGFLNRFADASDVHLVQSLITIIKQRRRCKTEFEVEDLPAGLGRNRYGQFVKGCPPGPGSGNIGGVKRKLEEIEKYHNMRCEYHPWPAGEPLPKTLAYYTTRLENPSAALSESIALGLKRDTRYDNNLETDVKEYCYLVADALARVVGKEYGGGDLVTPEDAEKLADVVTIMAGGPDTDRHLYHPELTPAQLKKAKAGRKFLIDALIALIKERGILEVLHAFAEKVTGKKPSPSSLALRNIFARYYTVEGDSSFVGWHKVGENPNTCFFPPHCDGAEYTVICTLPMPGYFEDGGMELDVIDPCGVEKDRWGSPGGEEGLVSVVDEIMGEGNYVRFKINEWEFCILANPTVHQVTKITKGERLTVIMFLGLGN